MVSWICGRPGRPCQWVNKLLKWCQVSGRLRQYEIHLSRGVSLSNSFAFARPALARRMVDNPLGEALFESYLSMLLADLGRMPEKNCLPSNF